MRLPTYYRNQISTWVMGAVFGAAAVQLSFGRWAFLPCAILTLVGLIDHERLARTAAARNAWRELKSRP